MDFAMHLTKLNSLFLAGALLAKAVLETVALVLSSPSEPMVPAGIEILSRVRTGPRDSN